MAQQLLPPTPVGVPPGHSFWNDWYEKLRTLVNGVSSGVVLVTQANQPNGYPQLNINGLITTGYLGYGTTSGAHTSANGIVLIDALSNKWWIQVSGAGVLSTVPA